MEWNHLKETMEDYTAYVEEAVKNNMPDYYELKNNINFFLEVNDTTFEICFKAPEYWKFANYGLEPEGEIKRNTKSYPPPDIIDAWISRRKITPESRNGNPPPTRKGLIFLISRKIKKLGFKGSGFLEKGLDQQQDYWEDRIATAVTLDINDQIMEWLSPLMGTTII